MGKSRNYDRESTLVDRLKRENAQLKRDYAKLRRQVDRLNLDNERYRTLKELVHKQSQEEKATVKRKKDWTCWNCGKGVLILHIFQRRDGSFYFRKCNIEGCEKQTKLQKFTPEVEGA